MHPKDKNSRRPVKVNKELLNKLEEEASRVWKQGWGSLGGIQRDCPSSQGSG